MKLVRILLVLLVTQQAFAVPARPGVISYQLPDGTKISIELKGDEYADWAITPDGYTLLFNSEGWLEYAEQDLNGDLQLSGVRAHNVPERQSVEQNFLTKTPKGLKYSPAQNAAIRELRSARQDVVQQQMAATLQSKTTGSIRIPFILVDFPDQPFTRTKQDFQLLMNQLNCTSTSDGPVTGSVRDYFLASSYGALDLQVDVFGPYRMPNNIGFYDYKNGGNSIALGHTAAQMASADGCDFSDYDSDGNGNVDGMHVIYAGYGQASGAPKGQSIWAHAYPDLGGSSFPLNGKRISTFSCSEELRDIRGSFITHIGVIAHELSHVLGVSDLYDTDYESGGGQSLDPASWCIMAGGSWNDRGRTPALHSAFVRHALGWISVTTLSLPKLITLPDPDSEGIAYRINTTTPNEYFLLENRQRKGWDAFIPGSGMLIYHVDENYSGWNNHCINCNPAHRGLYVKQAGGGLNSDGNNRSTDPYPSGGNNSFTDSSIPNSKSWAGANSNQPVTNIEHNTNSRTVSFNFMGAVEGVALNKVETRITINSTEQLTATVQPIDATNKKVSWHSSALAVATVHDGLITALSVGTAIITVKTEDGNFTAKCTLQVTPLPYTVTFNSQNGSNVAPQTVVPDDKVTKPKNPTRTGYIFGGWYKEAECVNVWDFATDVVTEHLTLYAKWNAVKISFTDFSINNNVAVTTQQSVEVEYVYTGGIPTHFIISETGDFVESVWKEYGETSLTYTFTSTENGPKVLYAKLKNSAGETTVRSARIYYKKTPEKLSLNYFALNGGNYSTNNRTVTLNHSVATGEPLMYTVSENIQAIAREWYPYSELPAYTLSEGNGLKEVFFAVSNGADTSEVWKGEIVLDQSETVGNGGLRAKLYPNPAERYIHVDLEEDVGDVRVAVYGVSGMQYVVKQYQGRQFRLDLSGCPLGVLLVKISQGKQYVVKRILKK